MAIQKLMKSWCGAGAVCLFATLAPADETICGRVVDAEGKPVAGARVLAFEDAEGEEDLQRMFNRSRGLHSSSDLSPVASHTESDRNGDFQLEGLQPLWYALRIVAKGHGPTKLRAVLAPTKGLVIRLSGANADLAGVVWDPAGNPVPDATVMAYEETSSDEGLLEAVLQKSRPPIDEVKTDAEGKFRFETLGAGPYSFVVTARSFQELTRLKVELTAGPNSPRAFSLVPGKVIRGVVLGPEGEPVRAANVRATRFGTPVTPGAEVRIWTCDDLTSTDEKGAFALDSLRPGNYILLLWHSEYASMQVKGVEAGGEALTVRVERGTRLRGTVLDAATQKPIRGAGIAVTDLAGVRKEGVSDDHGRYEVSGLEATKRPILAYVRAAGYGRGKQTIRLPSEDGTAEQNFALERTGTVAGTVLGPDRKPIAGAVARVYQDSDSRYGPLAAGTTDASGRFCIPEVEATPSAIVRVAAEGYLDAESPTFSVESGRKVEVAPIVLAAGGSIDGRVVDASARPVPDCWVSVWVRENGGITPAEKSGKSGRDGSFRLQSLRSGSYELVVTARGFRDRSLAKVAVTQGRSTSLGDIALEAEGR